MIKCINAWPGGKEEEETYRALRLPPPPPPPLLLLLLLFLLPHIRILAPGGPWPAGTPKTKEKRST